MTMLRNAFQIQEVPFWKTPICDPQSLESLIEEVIMISKVVQQEVEPEDLFWKGYSQLHHKRFLLRECRNEKGTGANLTLSDIEEYLETGYCEQRYDKTKLHLVKKVLNLHNATMTMFPNIFLFTPPIMKGFTTDFVKGIHLMLGEGIIANAGNIRTKSAQPAHENYYYVEPGDIRRHLEKLLAECREKFSDPQLGMEDAIKYGACFLEIFLFIHPFSNGNGRVARLLLSYLLSNFTVLPLSLYSTGSSKKYDYLQCLREARKGRAEYQKPASMSRLILENIDNAFKDVNHILDLEFYTRDIGIPQNLNAAASRER